MIGMISLIGAYVITGQIIPGIFWILKHPKSGNYINVVNQFKPKSAEKSNGRIAMIGVTALIGAYATTGQILPGFF